MNRRQFIASATSASVMGSVAGCIDFTGIGTVFGAKNNVSSELELTFGSIPSGRYAVGTFSPSEKRHVRSFNKLETKETGTFSVISEDNSINQSYNFTIDPEQIYEVEGISSSTERIGVELLATIEPREVVFKQQIYDSHLFSSGTPIATIESVSFER